MNKILQEDFDLAPCMVAGYESFMNGLLNIVHSGPICESVGEQIKSYVLDFVQNHPLDSFVLHELREVGVVLVRDREGADVDLPAGVAARVFVAEILDESQRVERQGEA